MTTSEIALLILSAYLLGSIPTSVWVGKIFYGIDIREFGSGNAGASNTFRVLGIRAGIPVLLFDLVKGWMAVKLALFTNHYVPGTSAYINFQLLLGMTAVIGHIFPIYVGFKGGKGVATLLGVVLALHPQAALMSVSIFVVILLLSRYVSLSSIMSGFSFPIILVAYFKVTATPLVVFSLVIAILLILTHQRNIDRLIKRQESKANIFGKKKKLLF